MLIKQTISAFYHLIVRDLLILQRKNVYQHAHIVEEPLIMGIVQLVCAYLSVLKIQIHMGIITHMNVKQSALNQHSK